MMLSLTALSILSEASLAKQDRKRTKTFFIFNIMINAYSKQQHMVKSFTKITPVILLIVLLSTLESNARKVHRVFPLKQLTTSAQTVFLGRFGISHSGATIVVKYGLKDQTSKAMGFLRAGILHADNYKAYNKAKTCQQKQELYHQTFHLNFFDQRQGMYTIQMGKGKTQHLSLLYMYSCKYQYAVNEEAEMTVDVLIYNKGNNLKQFGFLFIPYIALAIAGFTLAYKYNDGVLQQIKQKKNIISYLLGIEFVLFLVTLTIELIVVIQLIISGEAGQFFQSLSSSLRIISFVLISSTLIVVAWGWLLNNPAYKSHFLGILIATTLVNIAAEVIAENFKQQLSNEHIYQGKVGKLTLLMKIVHAVVFASGCIYVSTKTNEKRQFFIYKFTILGIMFLLAHLIAVLISFAIAPNYRNGEMIPLIEDIIEFIMLIFMVSFFALPREDPGYDTITGLGYDMEDFSMIERDDQQPQYKKDHPPKTMEKKVYQGKSADLI